MAGRRHDGPTPVNRHRHGALDRPELDSIFQELDTFTRDIVQYNIQTSQILRALSSQYHQDLTMRLEQLRVQVESLQEDISDLKRSHFVGLCQVFESPESIILDNLQTILPRLNSNWKQIWRVTQDDLHDRHAMEQRESLEEASDNISKQIIGTKDQLETTGNPSYATTLCLSARGLLEGSDTGSTRTAQTTNRQEHSIAKQSHGIFQEWQCPDCQRAVKFFVKRKHTAIESATFPPRVAGDSIHAKVKWREIWYAKSHLAIGKGAKYVCLLCLGEGKPLQSSCMFEKGKDLIKHIAETHNSSTLPRVFMRKLHITKGTDQNGGRSDLKFLRE